MRGETVIEYNGVTIRNCVTENLAQEAVLDPTGTDLIGHRFVLSVTGFCTGDDRLFTQNPSNTGTVNPNDPLRVTMDSFEGGGNTTVSGVGGINVNPVKQLVWLRSHLEKPRKAFVMRSGVTSKADGSLNADGSYMLNVQPYNPATPLTEWKLASPSTPLTSALGDKGGYDLNNGPFCRDVRILQTVGNTLYRIGVTFEVFKLECESGDGLAATFQGVLSNRWSVEDQIDNNRMTNRVIRGRLRVTTPYINANHFRGWVVPALQDGFRRDSHTFLVTADGLWLEYTIADKEIAYSAPQPATSWTMRHSEAIHNARESMGSIAITLHGHRDTPKQELMRTATAIFFAKLLAGVQHFRTEEFEISDEYGDNVNSVTITARVARAKAPGELKGGLAINPLGGLASTNLGKPITGADVAAGQPLMANYDRNKSKGAYGADPVELSGPISVVSAWNSYLQISCNDNHDMSAAKTAQEPDFVGTKRHDYTLYGFPVATLPTQTNATYLDQSENQFPYTHWEFESLFKQFMIRAQMPIAAASSYFTSGVNPSSVVVDLAGSVCTRVIRMKGTRIGKPPRLPPAPDKLPVGPSGSVGMISGAAGMATLMCARVKPMTLERTCDGQEIHTVSAEYQYAIPSRILQITGSLASLFLGVNPWEAAANVKQFTSPTLLGGPNP